eukprot:5907008-Pleurochrysis_carterae.AAC.4
MLRAHANRGSTARPPSPFHPLSPCVATLHPISMAFVSLSLVSHSFIVHVLLIISNNLSAGGNFQQCSSRGEELAASLEVGSFPS